MKKVNWKKKVRKAQQCLIDLNRPIHYKELFNIVCFDLPRTNGQTDYIENFRNYLDYHDNHFSHIGIGIFGLKIWYNQTLKLILPEFRTIDIDIDVVRKAYHEAIDREEFMVNKNNDPYQIRIPKIGDGLTAEKHAIREYIKKYNSNVIIPNNDIKTPCEFDFGIKTPIKTFYFDAKSSPQEFSLNVETYRLNNNVDFFIKVYRGKDMFRIDGVADKGIIQKHGVISDNGKNILVQKNKLIHEKTIDLFLNHCLLGIDCRKLIS